MKKLFDKIVMKYKDWRVRRIQRKLEIHLESTLESMIKAVEQLELFRNHQTFYGRKKSGEAILILKLGFNSLRKYLPVCSRGFQEEATAKAQLVAELIR